MIKALFFADTHLGIDWPVRPRLERRRRGDDFYANYLAVLRKAMDSRVDFVLHGGDLFYRSKIPDALVMKVLQPLFDLAEEGISVYLVPGNHERSRIPYSIFSGHPNIHIFDRPQSKVIEKEGKQIELSGFPYVRDTIRDTFPSMLEQLQRTWSLKQPDMRILCMHQIVEGARVGPSGYQFRSGGETIRCRDLPAEYDSILSGHIHRHQVLKTDLTDRPLAAPVYYPGSTERTSFAEAVEEKGYLQISMFPGLVAEFAPLPARPMVTIHLDLSLIAADKNPTDYLKKSLSELDPSSVVRLRIQFPLPQHLLPYFTAQHLRDIAPPTMNIQLSTAKQTWV